MADRVYIKNRTRRINDVVRDMGTFRIFLALIKKS